MDKLPVNTRQEEMFENNSRINFTDIFEPPFEHYKLERVWGTSYSISLDAYIMVLLAMENSGKVPEIEKGQELNKIQLLNIMERNLPKISILAQHGLISFNEKFSPTLQALLWKSVFPQIRENGSFHPKIWLAAFRNQDAENTEEYVFRLLVTSRNLTQDTDFDAAIVFESTPAPQGKIQEHPQIQEILGETLSGEWSDKLKRVQFFPFGKRYHIFDTAELPKEGVHSVVSPFLDNQKLSELRKQGLQNVFSTRKAISNLNDELKRSELNFYEFRMMDTVLTENISEEQSSRNRHYNIHAKLYFSEKDLYLGSRNCTCRGWNQNVEFMVKIPTEETAEKLSDSMVYNPEGTEMQSSDYNRKNALFQPCNAENLIPEPETEEEKTKSALVDFLKSVRANAVYANGQFILNLDQPELPGYNLSISPLLSWESANRKEKSWQKEIIWEDFPEKDVSPYFIVFDSKSRNIALTLFAGMKTEPESDSYLTRFKEKMTVNEWLEYLCSGNEVPLTNFRIEHFGESDSGNSSRKQEYGDNHRYLERLLRNITADKHLARKYSDDLEKAINTGSDGPSRKKELQQLLTFFKILADKTKGTDDERS